MTQHIGHVRRWKRLVTAGLFATAWACAAPTVGQLANEPGERHISVSGEGTVRVAPDMARADLGIRVVGGTVAEAMRETRERMERIVASLREAGIPQRDIATSQFSIHRERPNRPTRDRGDQGQSQPDQYVVTNMVGVMIRDLDRAAAVVDGAIDAGANEMRGISFALEDAEGAASRARELAATQARDRAAQLADLHGVSLGQPLRIVEGSAGAREPMMARASLAAAESATVSPGELTFRVRLQVIYEIATRER